jgi:kynurenine formamidase
VSFAKDYVGVDYHNDGHTHIDALCHVAYRGSLYNGKPASAVTSRGASVNAIDVLQDGLVGRGVLLDIPRLRGVPWLEPGEHIWRDDLEAAEREQGADVGEGDILLVRTGHARRLDEQGTWDTTTAKAGLHPTAMPFVAERGVVALGSDGNSRAAPRAWPSRSTSSPSTRWASTSSTTCSSRISAGPASAPGAGSSCSSPRRCASPAGPARPSIRSPSSDPA